MVDNIIPWWDLFGSMSLVVFFLMSPYFKAAGSKNDPTLKFWISCERNFWSFKISNKKIDYLKDIRRNILQYYKCPKVFGSLHLSSSIFKLCKGTSTWTLSKQLKIREKPEFYPLANGKELFRFWLFFGLFWVKNGSKKGQM